MFRRAPQSRARIIWCEHWSCSGARGSRKTWRSLGAVVSRGGRPDLAGKILDEIRTPTLLIVGGADYGVIELNEAALTHLKGPKALQIVPGATHLFPEPGALEAVIDHAARWFARYLAASPSMAGSRG